MQKIAQNHSLNEQEYQKILQILGREPNLTEVGIFGAMWSEHCSYKSTKIHLKKLYTQNKNVICGPGENAGVIDGLDEDAIIFKMESHNHPSYIEPFNGAATGVGGILRDIFTMGARPIANVNSLKFGMPDGANGEKMKQVIKGVIGGISFYGNCVGVPMAFGETKFDESYNYNVLVNAMAVGVAHKDKIFYSAANDEGASIIYFGSKTGKDGINGAKMSSGSFRAGDDDSQKPTIQVGDPFYEKLLIEATLELMQSGCVLAIQDMGAAGLTCSTAEMANKGGMGVDLNLDKVPLREAKMTAYEIMLSESQERMLMTVNQGNEEIAFKILKKWNLDHALIGKVTNTGRFIVKQNGKIEADLPIDPLSSDAPLYDRPHETENDERILLNKPSANDDELKNVFDKIMSSIHLRSKANVYERYDRGVQGQMVVSSPNAFGAVKYGNVKNVKIDKTDFDKNYQLSQIMISKQSQKTNGGGGCGINFLAGLEAGAKSVEYQTQKALLITSSITPRFTQSNAKLGTQMAVLQTYGVISAGGGEPIAITNCLNFAAPTNPVIMGQIIDAIEGMADVCKQLDYPVISGNASLYNQTDETPIKPTPTIGAVGIVNDYTKIVTNAIKNEEDMIFVIGETKGHLTNSLYAKICEGVDGGLVPQFNIADEKQKANFVRSCVLSGLLSSSAFVASGGILPTIQKMINTNYDLSGDKRVGVILDLENKTANLSLIQYLFAEDFGRYIVCVPKEKSIEFISKVTENAIIATQIGFTGGHQIVINGNLVG